MHVSVLAEAVGLITQRVPYVLATVVVVGRSPAVDALAEMAGSLGWGATAIDDGGNPDEHTRPGLGGHRLSQRLIRILTLDERR